MRAFLDWRTYHVALIAMLEGTVKNALLYWCPLIIHSLVGLRRPALPALSALLARAAHAGCQVFLGPERTACNGQVLQGTSGVYRL